MPQVDKDSADGDREEQAEELPPVPAGWQREIRCPITGIRVVAGRPGQRMVTSEDVRRLMEEEDEEDFP